MSKRFERGIWWIKRDFRLADNEALTRALHDCESVLPLFIIEPELCAAPETSWFHYNAWQQAARALNQALNLKGNHLRVCVGQVADTLARLHHADRFDAIYSHEETGSAITYNRDKAVSAWADAHKVSWIQLPQNGVIRGLRDRDKRSAVIRERLFESSVITPPDNIPPWQPDLTRQGVNHEQNKQPITFIDQWPEYEAISGRDKDKRIQARLVQRVSEADATITLDSFLHQRGIAYSGGISSPNTAFDAGSRLSVHLAWGTISLRRIFSALHERDRQLRSQDDPESKRWRKSLRAFQSRLHWHDHFIQRLESAPFMEYESLNPAYRTLPYNDNEEILDAWATGRTGLPIVDACMRCLAATGFLNFRMRAMLVSVGCFGLAQSWKSLQYPLARLFLDYEPGIHISQVQMQAGVVGINTLRVYSPHKQLTDQDPEARFVRRWVPELAGFTKDRIVQYRARTLGDYPGPIADIDTNARVMRDRIYAIRKSDFGQQSAQQVLKDHGSRLPGNDRARAAKRRGSRQSASTGGVSKRNRPKPGQDNRQSSSEHPQLSLNFDQN